MWSGSHEDIILCTIRKTCLHVVSGTPPLSILLYTVDINVVPFALVEHDYALGTLDALARVVLAPHWGLSWRESAGGGLDVGDLAVITYHVFVGLAAVVGNPETGADTTTWRALGQVCGDVQIGFSAVWSAGRQQSANDKKKEVYGVLVLGRKNDEILGSDLLDVILVGDGKSVAGGIWENNH